MLNLTKEKWHLEVNSSPAEGSPSASTSDTESYDELNELLTFVRIELESQEQCWGLPHRQYSGDKPEKKLSDAPTDTVLHTDDGKITGFLCHSHRHDTCSLTADISLTLKKEHLAKDQRCYRCTS